MDEILMKTHAFIVAWPDGRPKGRIEIRNGRLVMLELVEGRGKLTKNSGFAFTSDGPCRLAVTVEGSIAPGRQTTIASVLAGEPFSFFLRDVFAGQPIVIPACRACVLPEGDERGYAETMAEIQRCNIPDRLAEIENRPEDSFESLAPHVLDLHCPTWLGISRTFRIFEVGFLMGGLESTAWLRPRLHGKSVDLKETDGKNPQYWFLLGRGMAGQNRSSRRLDDGTLPILQAQMQDNDVHYHCTMFATLEKSALTAANIRGTEALVGDAHGVTYTFTPEQQRRYEELLPGEKNPSEQVVLMCRTEMVNPTASPRYAWFKAPRPGDWFDPYKFTYDGGRGFSVFESGRVFCVSRLNGKPMLQEEIAILLPPGGKAVVEFAFPHEPVSPERAQALAKFDFDARLQEARTFWRAKLATAARIELPDPRITEMIQAGLLHLDMVAYGREPKGSTVACVGVYPAIGTESSPIIQFMDSMGWHDLARRSIQYFFDKQHDDGSIQNFFQYTVETGAVLWTLGQHCRYVWDAKWARSVQSNIVKACEYLLAWRKRNQKPEFVGRGWGMHDGKVGDPEDPFHGWMLNSYGCGGLQAAGEVLHRLKAPEAADIAREAKKMKADIRKAFTDAIAHSPVIPKAGSTWCRTCPPWAEGIAPMCLLADKKDAYTHGTFVIRDAIGAMYLPLTGIIDPAEPLVGEMNDYYVEMLNERNVAFSQPYYSPHPFVQLARGEVKPFLAAYYGTMASLADRQTYTFWEHYHGVSPHKTHEEAWFLMQTRRMLYTEAGDELRLLWGVPRAWLQDGKRIRVERASSGLGEVNFEVESRLGIDRTIASSVTIRGQNKPRSVRLRLPHPENLKPISVVGGKHDAAHEAVVIAPFTGRAKVELKF